MFGLFKKRDRVETFWTWFSENEGSYRYFHSNPQKYLGELYSKIKKISNGLTIELEPPKDDVINMTISADGDIELFPLVQQIVDKAPKIEGWNFYAFRQRLPKEKAKGLVLKIQNQVLNPDKMKFLPVVDNNNIDIIVYIDNLTKENFSHIYYAGLILIGNILGEYDCVTKVRIYDFQSMPYDDDKLSSSLRPLLELSEYIDNFYGKKQIIQ